MADKRVKIGFETEADVSGAEKASDALDDVREKIDSMKDRADKASDGIRRLSDEVGAKGAKGGGLTKNLRTAGTAGRGLAAVLGGPVSRAASILSAGPLGILAAGAGLAAAAFMRFRRELEERVQAALASTAAAIEKFTESMGKIADRKNTEELEKFRKGIRDLSGDLDNERRSLAASNTLLDARLSVQSRLAELRRQERELELDGMDPAERAENQARIDAERAFDAAKEEAQSAAKAVEAAKLAEDQAKKDAQAQAANLADAEKLAAERDEAAKDAARKLRDAKGASGGENQQVLRDRLAGFREEEANQAMLVGVSMGMLGKKEMEAARLAAEKAEKELAEAERAAQTIPILQSVSDAAAKAKAAAETILAEAKTSEADAAKIATQAAEDAATSAQEYAILMDGLNEILRLQVSNRKKQLANEKGTIEAAAKAKDDADAETARRDAERIENDRTRGAMGIARAARGAINPSAPGGQAAAERLQILENELSDGASAEEIDLLHRALAWMEGMAKRDAVRASEIAKLQAQLRNLP